MRLKNKKVLITGAAGFIGSHLADKCVAEGAEVYGIDNLSSGKVENINHGVKFELVDIKDFGRLIDCFESIKPDIVFHLAAWGRMPMCLEDSIGAYQNNVMGSLHVLEAARHFNVKKVVLSSSCIVYGEETPYKSSKVAMEDIARVYRKSYGVKSTCLRYGNVFGTRQDINKDSAMFAMLRKKFNESGVVDIFGDGEQTRDWVFVADIAEANVLAALSDFEGELDIATGRSISLNYIIEYLKLKANYLPERPGDARHIMLNPELAKKAIGFEAKTPFEEGIKEVWE